VEEEQDEEDNKALKEKNHGSQAGLKMKQKKHNLGNTKNTSNNQEVKSEDEALEKARRVSADPLPNRGGKAWQGDSVDQKSTSIQKKLSHKKLNVKKTNERHNSNSDDLGQIKNSIFKFASSDEDASIFNTICGNDLKKEVAKNVKLSMKMATVDIFITGPFCNAKTGKSSWIIFERRLRISMDTQVTIYQGIYWDSTNKNQKADYQHLSLQFFL
jgi:hypothetical protein